MRFSEPQSRRASIPATLTLLLVIGLAPWQAAQAQATNCPANLEQGTSCNGGGARDAGAAPVSASPTVTLGNPVSLVTGNKTQREVDYAAPGSLLGFTRHYASAGADENIGLGQGWRHTYAVWMLRLPDDGRLVIDSTGRRVFFDAPSDGASGAGAFFPARLASDGHLLGTAEGAIWAMPDGRRMTFRGSFLVRIDRPGNRFLSLHYRQRRVATVTDEAGRVLAFEYTPGRVGLPAYDADEVRSHSGHLAALVLPDGNRVEYAYDERRNLTRARFADGTARRYHYENALWPSHLTGLTERTGTRFATWSYDEAGRATASSHADGAERVTLTIKAPEDAPGEDRGVIGDEGRTFVTNSEGGLSRYRWRRDPRTGASQLLEATGVGCISCPPTGRRYAYDAEGRLTSVVRLDEEGRPLGEVRRDYDERGRPVRVAETLSGRDDARVERLVERRAYDGDSYRPSLVARPSVNPSGEHVTETRYSAAGLPTSITERGFTPVFAPSSVRGEAPSAFEPISRTTALSWEGGRLVAVDGPREDVADVTRFEWDERSRLVAIHPQASPSLRFSRFDAHGRPVEFHQGARTPVVLERDARGDIVSARRGKLVVRYVRDAEGRLSEIVDEDGRRVRIAHDVAGRVSSVTDDLGRVTRLEHDGENRRTDLVSLGLDGETIRSIETLFDARGRVRRTVTREGDDAGGARARASTIDYERDGDGRIVGMRDPLSGAAARVDLDLVERLVSLSRADGTASSVGLDATGRETHFEDARGNVTHRPADDFGRIVLSDDPDTGRVRFRHDAAGNRVEARHESGAVVRFAYDAAGRILSRTDADGIARWRWDETTGTLLEVTNGTTVERFEYDADTRLLRHVREIDGLAFETGYAYDARGRLVGKRLPDGQRLRRHYHESGPNRGTLRAIVRERWFGLGSETLAAEIDLDVRDGAAGHLAGNGVRTQQTFASNGEVRRIEVGGELALGYTFDEAGRIVAIEENGEAQRYAYARGRLVAANTRAGNFLYTWDALGNRTGEMRSGPESGASVVRHTYATPGEGNRLLESADGVSEIVTSYRHGSTGAPLAVGGRRYTYDASGRPVSVRENGELLATYAYNAFGERVKKIVYATDREPLVTYFLYDGHTLVAEADGRGEVTAQYVYLDGHRPFAKLTGRDVYAIHTDHLGTPRSMTDEKGIVVWHADYTPFGRATVRLESVRLPLRLPGQYADAETGTHYNYLRDYDPGTGRYLTADPIGLAGGENRYAYVANSPLDGSDPFGLFRFPRPGAESDALIASLTAMTAEERRTYVMTELGTFNDREKFYYWAHEVFQTKPGASRNDWFLAASQVNGDRALGGIEAYGGIGAIALYDAETVDYLQFAGLELAVHNLDTFVTMIGGGFVYDICLAAPTESGRAEARSEMMVRYEQERLQQITADYFADRPAGEEAAVYADINAFFNAEGIVDFAGQAGIDPVIRSIIRTEFTDRGVEFDIGNIEHRVRLGELMVEANRVG